MSERPDGQRELHVLSNETGDPVVLKLDDLAGNEFGLAVADVLTALDAGVERLPIRLQIDGREITVSGDAERGLLVAAT